ncbi:MAG TPA: NADH-quinone oxidoreductase subunit N [Lacipirellulaceae bacterium]|nr:NADH-quinone oxidoreductase subunit N [Lacipirellulaceae bacterium]
MPSTIELIRSTASLLVPEIILLATACVLFLIGPFCVDDAGETVPGLRHRWGVVSLVGLGIAWFVWLHNGSAAMEGTLFRIDALAWYTRLLSLSAGVLLVLVLWDQIEDSHSAEAYACLLSILAGTNLVAAANDLTTLFLALELVSIPTYVILYLPRRDQRTSEAALKYFLLSIFSSALVLYGMAWLYGVAGTTSFAGIRDVLSHRPPHAGEGMLEIAFALLLAGLSFRITAVPFHFYAPDVFQGTTAANAALLSIVPKVVGFAALLRLIPLSGATVSWLNWVPEHSNMVLLGVMAVVTMFVGNLMALRQRHLYRLMAYSSIAHAGYMLIGLTVGDTMPVNGREAVLFYLAVYGLMTVGVFALLSAAGTAQGAGGGEQGVRNSLSVLPRACTTLDDIRGLSRSLPSVALLLAICLFSLTGLPPTAGFLGKLNLFFAAWSEGSNIGHGLAILLALNAAISAWYYLRLVAMMYLEPAGSEEESLPRRIVWAPWLAGAACAIATIVIFVAPQWLWSGIH